MLASSAEVIRCRAFLVIKGWRIGSFYYFVKDTSSVAVRNFFFIFNQPIPA
jgi:hypothetical protein